MSVACDPLPPERAARWVLHRAKQIGIEVEAAAADLLVRSVGVSLGELAAELEKLVATSDGLPVTAERVAAVVGIRQGETIHDWRDALFSGEAGPAVACGTGAGRPPLPAVSPGGSDRTRPG